MSSQGQQGYKLSDIIIDFPVQKKLNSTSAAERFSGLQKELTIIDFFGTWCAPCIRALPHLADIYEQYGGKVGVVLVSSETEAQLQRFIFRQKNLPFPVIADENKKITELFQPPALPYTVVINKNNKIVFIGEASSMTNEMIYQWLQDNSKATKEIREPEKEIGVKEKPIIIANLTTMNTLLQLSQDFIYTSKTGNETTLLEKQLAELPFDSLKTMLKTDDEKKAFWINLYNGFTQATLKKDPGKYKSRSVFFKAGNIFVGSKAFSLDDIEHGILRRSSIKWSLGYLKNPFPGKTEKALRVKNLDSRIHFALNCGAKSCPPIAFYDADKINAQLDLAARSYLSSEAIYNAEKNTLLLPAIMGWFRHDFKGKKNMLLLVKKYGIIPEAAHPKISFAKYDWSLSLNNYSK